MRVTYGKPFTQEKLLLETFEEVGVVVSALEAYTEDSDNGDRCCQIARDMAKLLRKRGFGGDCL